MKTCTHHTIPIILLALTGLSGCQSVRAFPSDNSVSESRWDLRKRFGRGQTGQEPPQIPTRVVSTWSDAVLHREGKKPMRGFGGRLIFFGHEGEDPVHVEGQLVVYAFDETCRPQHDTSPTKKYVFPAEQFVRHASRSKLGPSYSVWLPWDDVGGGQKNISLIVRFEPRGGSIVLGEQTRHLLPGSSPRAIVDDGHQASDYLQTAKEIRNGVIRPEPASRELRINPIQLASAEIPAGEHPVDRRRQEARMKVTSIRLPAGSSVKRILAQQR